MNVNGIIIPLVISKHIVEAFGGTIHFSTKYRIRSEFTFTVNLENNLQEKVEKINQKLSINNKKRHLYRKPEGLIINNMIYKVKFLDNIDEKEYIEISAN